MATSDRGFWAGPTGRYLLSRRNIVGGVLALVAVVVNLVVGLGALWPVVIVAAYALGVVVTPPERPLVSLAATGPDADVLRGRLEAECRRLVGAGAVPEAATGELEAVRTALRDVLDRWPDLAAAPQQRALVESIVTDYLPATVSGFLEIPPSMRAVPTGRQATSAADELVTALGYLRTGSGEIRQAVVADDLEALRTQGRFLRERFGRSELDL